jgi:flagellar basal body rod protein FlgG
MIDGVYAALSAVDAFSKTMAVTANNVANINTSGFKKSRAIAEEGQNGAVEVSIQEIDTPGSLIPSEESSTEQTETTSNVNIAEEMVHMTITQLGYEANLKSLEVQEELQGFILNILG